MKVIVLGLSSLLYGITLHAQQPGLVDPTFNVSDTGLWNGHGFQGGADNIKDAVVQADGKIIVGGSFMGFDGYPKRRLARMNANATCDLSFPVGAGANGDVHSLALQPDGKILVGGAFTTFHGISRRGLVRLNSDGSLDNTFQAQIVSSSAVIDIVVATAGTVTALFDNGDVERYSATGTSLGGVPGSSVATSFLLQPDGKTVIAGAFTKRIERRTSAGALDPTFVVGTGFNGTVLALGLLPDGDIIAVGWFTTYKDVPCPRIARLDPDGSLDGTFGPGSGFNIASSFGTWSLQVLNGSLYINGPFTAYNGVPRSGVVQIAFTGELMDMDPGCNGPVSAMLNADDGGFHLLGAFSMVGGAARRTYARINADGSLQNDQANIATGLNGLGRTLAVQADGKVLCGGGFTGYNRTTRANLIRIQPDGTLDDTFNSGTGFDGNISHVLVDPLGRILVAGQFKNYNGIPRAGMARLHPDGTLDTTLDIGTGFTSLSSVQVSTSTICIQSDGRYVVGGSFHVYDGQVRRGLVRLMPNGTLDGSFSGTFLASDGGAVWSIVQRPDGKLVCGGRFTEFNGQAAGSIVQLFPDGSIDTSFDTDPGFTTIFNDVNDMVLEPDGNLVVTGWFSSYGGSSWNGLIRLFPNGTADPSFRPFTNLFRIFDIERQPDGRILCTGSKGAAFSGLVRVETNGAIDGSFQIGQGPVTPMLGNSGYGDLYSLAMDGQGRAIVTGSFMSLQGLPRNNIARIQVHAEQSIRVSAKVFLEGAYDQATAQMRDDLRAAGHLPLTEPYTALGYARAGAVSESTTNGVFAQTGPNAIVDWVLLELRHAQRPDSILATRSALVQRDGDIVDMDGTSPVLFAQWPAMYHLAVRHRNHLSVMTLQPIGLHGAATTVDFTLPITATFGAQAQRTIGERTALRSGNVNGDGKVSYTGAANDRDPILVRIGGTVPTNSATGYLREDVNMNGQVRYTGANNDRDIILMNIGGVVPTYFVMDQLP